MIYTIAGFFVGVAITMMIPKPSGDHGSVGKALCGIVVIALCTMFGAGYGLSSIMNRTHPIFWLFG